MAVQRDLSWHRHPVAPARAPGVTYPATAEAIGAARRQVVRVARAAGAAPEAVTDIGLAVTEASTNALLHAGARGEAFTVATAHKDALLSVWVTDAGQGGMPRAPSPGLGLGLELMARLSERVLLGVLEDGRTQVEMRFHLGDSTD